MSFSHTSTPSEAPFEAEPLVHARAVVGASLIGTGLAAVAALLWTAFAFSSDDSWAYAHLAWWIGASIIGGALVAGVAAGALSNARGAVAGVVNGAAVGAVLVVLAGGLALLALAVNGSLDQALVIGNHTVLVDFARPFVAFWAAAGALVAGAIGGAAGGLLPRHLVTYPQVELAPVSTIGAAPAADQVAAGF